MTEDENKRAFERKGVCLDKREFLKKTAYVPPTVTAYMISSTFLGRGPMDNGSEPPPPPGLIPFFEDLGNRKKGLMRMLGFNFLGTIIWVKSDLNDAVDAIGEIFGHFRSVDHTTEQTGVVFSMVMSNDDNELQLVRGTETLLETRSYPHLLATLEYEVVKEVIARSQSHLFVHAAATAKGDTGILIPAGKGAGKTTLCAHLVSGGHTFLADDTTAVNLDTSKLVPFCLPFHIKGETESMLRRSNSRLAVRTYGSRSDEYPARHALPPRDLTVARSFRTGLVIFPRYAKGVETRAVEIGFEETACRLARHFMNADKHGSSAFATAAAIAGSARAYRLEYDDPKDAVAAIDHLCEC